VRAVRLSGLDGLAGRFSRRGSVRNRIADKLREDVVCIALKHENLTPRKLPVKYTDEKRHFVLE
jgi:hypothetical protein